MAALAVLAAAELRRGDDAMLPPTLLRRPAFTAANTTAGIMNLCTLGTLFVLMLFHQSVQHRSALLPDLSVVPLFARAVMAPVGGRITSRLGPRLPAAAGLLVGASGLALLTRSGAHSGYVDLLPAFLLWGTGCGLLTPAVVAAAIATVPAERSGLASAVNNTARQTSGAIGIAVATRRVSCGASMPSRSARPASTRPPRRWR
ncbi:MFS transporter [Streptomyces canus]|uniref:MFS transporter n=1 Tax=Streptomyces canus TaxID=58343 RepID=UPI00371E02B0